MIRTYGKACAVWLCRFLYMQSFLSLVSLPILIAWGLPFSYATALGNLIFSPIIMLFLLSASLVFFCHLVHLPCGMGVVFLEQLSALWSWLLALSDAAWLSTFASPSLPVLVLIPCCAVALIIRLASHSLWIKAAVMTTALIVTCCALRVASRTLSPTMTALPCARGDITFVYKYHQLIMVDSGGMGACKGTASWAQYTCAPHIAKTYGMMHLDHLVILKATATTLKTIIALQDVITIKNLYIAGAILHHNQDLANILASLPINVVSLDRDAMRIDMQHDDICSTISMCNDSKKRYGTVPYMMTIDGVIDNETVTLYPSGYTKRTNDVCT